MKLHQMLSSQRNNVIRWKLLVVFITTASNMCTFLIPFFIYFFSTSGYNFFFFVFRFKMKVTLKMQYEKKK